MNGMSTGVSVLMRERYAWGVGSVVDGTWEWKIHDCWDRAARYPFQMANYIPIRSCLRGLWPSSEPSPRRPSAPNHSFLGAKKSGLPSPNLIVMVRILHAQPTTVEDPLHDEARALTTSVTLGWLLEMMTRDKMEYVNNTVVKSRANSGNLLGFPWTNEWGWDSKHDTERGI